MRQVLNSLRDTRGFTIVEILVVLTTMMVITSMAFAGFYTYSRSQAVEQASQDMKIQIEKAKFNALSRVKPSGLSSGCGDTTTLTEYRFRISGSTYSISAICSAVPQEVETYNLPPDLTFSPTVNNCEISFLTGTNSVSSNNNCAASGNVANIAITGFTFQRTVRVDNGGNVTITNP